MRSQAHRTSRIPGWYIGLGAIIAAAAMVVGVGWFALQAFLGMAQYIPSVLR